MPASQPHVLIVGAGLGGLVLAQVLRKHDISFEIFERDAGPGSRTQGWAVSLQWILGDLLSSTVRDMPPLKNVNINPGQPSKFSVWDGTTGERTNSNDGGLFGKVHLRANRRRLRKWLQTNVEVRWGKRFVRFETRTDGVTAFFEDGTSATGDVLVGADGINSRVRRQLHNPATEHVCPKRLPCFGILGEVHIDAAQYERFKELGGSFYLVNLNGGRIFVGVQDVTEQGAEAYWMANTYDPEALNDDHPLRHATQQQLLDYALKMVSGADPKLSEIIRATTVEGILLPQVEIQDMIPHPIPRGRVTLLGDAVHPMTYFRGEGANHAMQDGLNLGKMINAELGQAYGLEDGKFDVEELLKKYEAEMIPRSTKAVEGSRAAALEMKNGSGN